ncbi:hypothetical protein EVAR_93126_1 [Eumeta japonica]|uniref:Uncharacterized protein n=1 Tax=Eumeta variegata TaxID=151549 RepID=A0A4C1TG29_EUMVA|nr:hypothetical protein EVAR_93126_1 [Eumeta japonica]
MAALRHLLRKAMVAMNQVFNGILHTSHFPETWERGKNNCGRHTVPSALRYGEGLDNGLLHKLLDTPMPSALTRVIASFLHQCNFCVDVKEALSAPARSEQESRKASAYLPAFMQRTQMTYRRYEVISMIRRMT